MSLLLLTSTALAGQYALIMEQRSMVKIPFFGRSDVLTRSVSLVTELAEPSAGDGQSRTAQVQTCFVDIDDDSPGKTLMPEAFIAALPTPVLSLQPGHNSPFIMDMGLSNIGWTGIGTLPHRQRDPRIIDHEEDGRPGATIELRVPVFGRVWLNIVQRAHIRLHGQWSSPHAASGWIETLDLQQRTLSASVPGFGANPPIEHLDERSQFSLFALSESSTCDDLKPTAVSLN